MRAGSTIPELFQNYHEKKWSESEKWGRKALDCKGDGYMWGLGGAKKGKSEKSIGFFSKIEGSKAIRRPRSRLARKKDMCRGEDLGGDLGYFDVEKLRVFIKNALCLYLELCFPCGRGAQFQKNREKKWPESENWSQNNVGYIKILPKWGRIHVDGIKIMSDTSLKSPREANRSNNTRICNVF